MTYDVRSTRKKTCSDAPYGSVMGIFARNTHGIYKTTANEVVRSCVGAAVQFCNSEMDFLNPKGANLIRAIPGQGIRVWGAGTANSNGMWKYVNVR